MVKRNQDYELLASPRSTSPQDFIIFGAPLAVEYSAPSLFVAGPTSEMSQYQNAGQWYYNTDDGRLYTYIP